MSMQSLPIHRVHALMQALERIYSADNIKQFPETVFSALGDLLVGSFFSLDTLSLATGQVISATIDFTDEAALLLNLAAPQIALAHRNLQRNP